MMHLTQTHYLRQRSGDRKRAFISAMSMSSHSQPPAAMPGYGGHAAGIVGYKQEAGCDGRTAAGNGFTRPANHSQYSHYNGYSGYTGHGYGDGLDPGQVSFRFRRCFVRHVLTETALSSTLTSSCARRSSRPSSRPTSFPR